MSAFFGELSRTQQPVDPNTLAAMAAAIPWYGPDGGGQWCSNRVGFGHLQHRVTPESRYERQPLLGADNRHLFAGNVRLDNRSELIDQLRLAPMAAAPLTDPDLVLAAYAAWGEACPHHLLGDFAFVIWDFAAQKLVCVRDQIGIAPFYYYLSPARFVFACDLRAIVAHPAAPHRLNDDAVALHLRYVQYRMPEMTFLAGVKKLQPARILIVTAKSVREQIYWTPEDAPAVYLPNPAAYAGRLRHLLEEAVRCRLRSSRAIGAHVSGGLDSSAIAVLAQQQLREQGQSLAGYSWLPPLGSAADAEAPEYAATQRVAALGINVEHVDLTAAAVCSELERDISLDGYTDLWYESLVRARAKERGVGVLLSGWGGDEVVSSGGKGYLAELFWRGSWRELARLVAARSQRAANPRRQCLSMLYGQVWLPSLPAWLQTRWPGIGMKPMDKFSCIAPAFAAATQSTTQAPSSLCVGVHATQARRLTLGHLQARIEAWASQGARDGLEYRYPLLDRRLVEFCLGAPPCLFFDRQTSRYLFRQAVAGLLPDEVRLANVKLESLRVARYIEVTEAACAQWWAKEKRSDEAARIDEASPAPRYLDPGCVTARQRQAVAAQDRIGYLIGQERQIQVLVMARRLP